MPGSIGDIIFFPGKDGPFKETQTIVVDSGIFVRDIMAKRKENADFEVKKNDFNQKKIKYDRNVDKFIKREKDIF